MKIKIFTVPIIGGESEEEEMNRFLSGNRILDIESGMSGNYWSFCIRYLGKQTPSVRQTKKIDYKQVLSEKDFKKFSLLRQIRKEISVEEAVPAFAIFTDAELSELAKQTEITIQSMKEVHGIGKKKVERYGRKFLNHLEELKKNEETRESDS